MNKLLPLIVMLFLLGCSSIQLVEEWKNPTAESFSPHKILVIGMTSDVSIRRNFETLLSEALEKEGIVAVRSVDFFESKFHSNPMKQTDLDAVEQELLQKEFDAVLMTQLMAAEEKVAFLESHREPLLHSNFKDFYLHHQDVFKTGERTSYVVYHTHTSFYCLCPGNERELLWSGGIDLTGPGKEHASIKSFTKKLIKAMKHQSLLEKN